MEQKNGAVVRRIVRHRHFEELEATAMLDRPYRSVRLYVKFLRSSFKLADTSREGARVKKRCHPPATPC